jgi:hypothetical protein
VTADPIRIFVGCAAGGEDAESCAVLEYSIRSQTDREVEITWMHVDAEPKAIWGGWDTRGWATPFSGLRWGIPAACNYQGRAIYMDSDMIVRADIGELWDQEIPKGKFVLIRETEGKLRTCVMLMNCDVSIAPGPTLKTLKNTRDQHGFMTSLLKRRRDLLGKFDGQWNCIDLKRCDGIDDPDVKVIHYSSMPHQPHLKWARARLAAQGRKHWFDGETAAHWRPELQDLFDRMLTQAEAAGFHPAMYDWGGVSPRDKKSFAGKPVKRVAFPAIN